MEVMWLINVAREIGKAQRSTPIKSECFKIAWVMLVAKPLACDVKSESGFSVNLSIVSFLHKLYTMHTAFIFSSIFISPKIFSETVLSFLTLMTYRNYNFVMDSIPLLYPHTKLVTMFCRNNNNKLSK